MENLVIKNIGKIITGDINEPVIEAESIYIEDGRIKKIGNLQDVSIAENTTMVDAKGLSVCPGIIDAHTHPGLGDYIPSIKAVDWIISYLNGGVTSMISAGAIGLPGFPNTVSGVKGLAVLSKEVWNNHRPGQVKVHGECLTLAEGLKEEDFKEMAKEGIKVISEVGMGSVKDPDEVLELVKLAKQNGFKVMAHSGGASGKDCASYTAEDIIKINPDIVCHLNGAPTPMSKEDVKRLIMEEEYYFDVISTGNVKMSFDILEWAQEADKLDKIMIGTNAPSMAGFSPLGSWMMMGSFSEYAGFDPAKAIAMATGNVSRCYDLDHGLVKEGYKADLLICDRGSAGNEMLETMKSGRVPSIAMVIIDGEIILTKCKNTAPPSIKPIVTSSKKAV